MSEANTHLGIDETLCGVATELSPGRAVVRLTTTPNMAADDRGLVHGGFVFGAADYAAMLAVNDPNVVLGSADTRFTAPVAVGQVVELSAERTAEKGRKHTVSVSGTVEGAKVFEGTFVTFVLDQHVLD